MAKIRVFPSKTLHPIPNQTCLIFNSSFSKFLTKKSSPSTQYLILNKNVSENDDSDDDYKFSWNKKTGKKYGFQNLGRGCGGGSGEEYLPLLDR